ncbi:zf-HC2 domain-containing protein [Actinophytocola sp.]|uniref:zf-HC2 domain-containing protein n=1 Tax=Actinophytocola sp. TaxID=1872138 RepID=UPI003D6B152D
MTCSNTVTLGAYLLGALDPRERFEFEAHLGGCDTCRTELVRLAPLPGMLNQISLDDFSDGLPPTTLEEAHPTAPVPGLPLSTQLLRPETSLPEVLHPELFRPGTGLPDDVPPELGGPVPTPRGPAALELPPAPPRAVENRSDTPAKAPRRRRYWHVAAAAAVVLVLAVGGVLGWQALQPDPAPPAVPPVAAGVTWSGSTPDGSATADARLIDHEWGTEIQIKLHGLPPGRECYMVVYDGDGYHEVAGWWSTDHDYAAEIPASTSIQRSKIDKLELRLDDRSIAMTIPAQGR